MVGSFWTLLAMLWAVFFHVFRDFGGFFVSNKVESSSTCSSGECSQFNELDEEEINSLQKELDYLDSSGPLSTSSEKGRKLWPRSLPRIWDQLSRGPTAGGAKLFPRRIRLSCFKEKLFPDQPTSSEKFFPLQLQLGLVLFDFVVPQQTGLPRFPRGFQNGCQMDSLGIAKAAV